jgi:hypothetical protein
MGTTTGSTVAASSIGADTTFRSGERLLLRLRRRGAGGVTTGSSICRNSNSKNRSKSFICIRNASLNGTTQAQTETIWSGPRGTVGIERGS